MSATAYQGLFYLTGGALAFLSLGVVFSILGRRKESGGVVSDRPTWTSKEELTIIDVIQRTHDVKTIRLKRSSGDNFDVFSPGQFLSFQIGDDEKTLRSYSISSSGYNNKTIDVSVKLLKDGVGSSWFHNRKKGEKVFAFPPSGLFTYDEEDKSDLVFVAGGIGITPFISMVKTLAEQASDQTVSLFYGMKSQTDMAFHQELIVLTESYSHFNYYPILSNDDDYDGDKGYINLKFVQSKIKDNDLIKSKFFFCGPPIMTDGLMDQLEVMGVSDEALHAEKFASPTQLDPSQFPEITTKIKVNGKEYDYSGRDSLLEFLEKNKLPAKFACRVGVCGSCKCKVTNGSFNQLTDAGLSRKESKEGYILSCVTRPVDEEEILTITT